MTVGRLARPRDQSGRQSPLAMVMVQLAWGWLKWQPQSVLTRWYRARFGQGNGRENRIVALARKLLIALWRYATTGGCPTGAILRSRRGRPARGTRCCVRFDGGRPPVTEAEKIPPPRFRRETGWSQGAARFARARIEVEA